MDIISNVF